MALKATIYKAVVNVADLDRNQFLDASLTLARHPSETQERMMLRLLAWIKYADERLQFTRWLKRRRRAGSLGCVTIIWVSIYGLNLVCRMSAASKRRVPSLRKWRYSRTTNALRKSGGSKTRARAVSLKTLRSGIWMMKQLAQLRRICPAGR
ncbi:YaeQ protein [Enterobacter cloacae]|uniref:YaeQ protein n=1 Tax=Enterobacter cloacae TaxID=550 RepID=A0A377M812_ENTCL|nr:YaeQ protein [Enterobacter cloacae]